MFDKIKARLVADWATIRKMWSVRMTAVGAVLYPLLISVSALPPDVQALFPLKYRAIAAGVFSLASLAARLFTQPKLNG